jgi:hypothetical protein
MEAEDERLESWEVTITSSDLALIRSMAEPPPNLDIEIEGPTEIFGVVDTLAEVVGVLQAVGFNVLGSLIAAWIAHAVMKRGSSKTAAGSVHVTLHEQRSRREFKAEIDVEHLEDAERIIAATLRDAGLDE